MATDKTEPPIKTILVIAGITFVSLIGVRLSLVSYFHSMYEAQEQSQVLGVESQLLKRARDAENERLRNGNPTAINAAMEQIASGARPTAIEPQASTDTAALQGWGLRQRVVPTAPPAPGQLPTGAVVPPPNSAANTQAPASGAPGDGGTPTTGTAPAAAGTAPTAAPAAGAPANAGGAAPTAPAALAPSAPTAPAAGGH
jgi:hypothetical protein